jgi:hypothetical protein
MCNCDDFLNFEFDKEIMDWMNQELENFNIELLAEDFDIDLEISFDLSDID